MSADPTAPRSFAAFLGQVEDGDLHARLSDTLRDLIATLREVARNGNGKAAGKLTLDLGFKVDGGTVDVVSHVSTKTPKLVPARSVFWMTDDAALTRRDPRQPDLPLRDALADRGGAVKTVQ